MNMIKELTNFLSNKEVVIIFIYLIAMVAVPGIGFIAALHLILIALVKKKEWYFKSLMYFAILKQFNFIFHPPPTNLFLLFVILLFIIFLVTNLSLSKIRLYSIEKKFYLLMLLFAITSIIGSFYPVYSLLRIAIVFMFFFVVFQSMRRIGSLDLLQFMIRLTTILIFASLPLTLMGSGYLSGGLFMGIINHSQSFALMLLPLLLTYFIAIYSRKIPNSFFHVTVISIGFVELVLSGSRAAVGGVIVALILYFMLKKRRKISLKSLTLSLFLLFGLITIVSFNFEKVEQKISLFFLKHGQASRMNGYSESIEGRLYLIEVAKENIKQYPFTGVGYNVQTYFQNPDVRVNLDNLIKYIPGTDIQYSRPLEKGNLYSSVFEEGGIFVGLFFLYIILYLLWLFYSLGLSYLWVPFIAMMFNFNGEAALFAPSGAGNFQFIVIASFYLLALKELTKKRVSNV